MTYDWHISGLRSGGEDEYSNLMGFEDSAASTVQQLEEHFKQLYGIGGGGGEANSRKRSVDERIINRPIR